MGDYKSSNANNVAASAVVADNQSFEVNFKMCHVVNFVRPSAIPTSDIAHLCLSPDVCIM